LEGFSKLVSTAKSGNFGIGGKIRHHIVQILKPLAGFSLPDINFAQKQKDYGLIVYFFCIL
jgi:hypothetical protein